MLVDGTKFRRIMSANILKSKGCEIVAEAEDGLETVDLYPRFAPL